jgi:hypothetical protein
MNPYISNIKVRNKSISNDKYTEFGLMLDKIYKDIQERKQTTFDEL